MKIVINRAKREDKQFVLYANCEIDKCSFISASNLSQNIDKDLFERKKCVCLIAKVGQKRVGMILFSKVYWADRGEGVYVSQVFVEREYRCKGVFKLLMARALKYFKNTNFLTCLVSQKNKNMVYCMEKLSFEDEGMISYAKNKSDIVNLS